ncbi:competence/damage-inducible protein A [Herbinix luporum]|jgi:nicotinamide-nucleotide amidase|uniref:Putative competence-damage inducible protein n=1 Tax=Herbinix luporum TaxID=1679721 RepID=A0A0K8J5B2_9FIRM|nr:competence/damage-inducible protein A [Herbinix luporum]MDI9489194.1 competence/damage-inducible protein A [Bacillota bacterium]CUH92642.1 putative competence-damage inducible protein [Herbinix luporum]
MTVELISIGTELLLGNIINTNATYLSIQCAKLGFTLYHQITVGDNEVRLSDVIKTAQDRSDIIILTGGLGPTSDDITKETLAKVVGRELVMDEHSKERILSYYKQLYAYDTNKVLPKGLELITENNWKQALKIRDSIVIDNDNGTAPGYIVEDKNKIFILLPGPPGEMIPMFENHILPYLKKLQDKVFLSKMVKICGIGESKAETMIMDLIKSQTNPTIAPYAKSGEVHFRITAGADKEEEAEALIKPIIKELKARFGNNIYTTREDITLEKAVIDLLINYKLTLATAESCTGGLLSGRIVNVAGASQVFTEGFITYSNQAKIKYLNVNPDTLNTYGAVSEETAKEMALGLIKTTGCDVAVAVTGIAGPDGGTKEKPVGLVYISCSIKGKTFVKRCNFKGNRAKIREQSVVAALDLVRRSILEIYV